MSGRLSANETGRNYDAVKTADGEGRTQPIVDGDDKDGIDEIDLPPAPDRVYAPYSIVLQQVTPSRPSVGGRVTRVVPTIRHFKSAIRHFKSAISHFKSTIRHFKSVIRHFESSISTSDEAVRIVDLTIRAFDLSISTTDRRVDPRYRRFDISNRRFHTSNRRFEVCQNGVSQSNSARENQKLADPPPSK